jgi:VanZ family protein
MNSSIIHKFLKLISLFYLFLLTMALLVPINFFLEKNVVESEPTNETGYIIHLILFFILFFIFYISFKNKKVILFFCSLYGVLIEFAQILTSRGFSFEDIFYNLVGIGLAYILIKYFYKFKHMV